MGRGTVREVRRHAVPAWWRDAKLGIFVHWTPASVPAFAPTDVDVGALLGSGARDALASAPYTEWYENSLRFPDSPVARHHRSTYGDRPYRSFAADFEAGLDGWDPDAWATSFREAGARYVVLVAKHHDGWCLWPTAVANPHQPGWHSSRDLVGELAEAVRCQGLRFGLYYSGGLDWTFDDTPIGTTGDLISAAPRGPYPAYAEAQVRELIARYRPSVLWNDITWPQPLAGLADLFADYYRAVPDGVVNDRWMPWGPAMAIGGTRAGRWAIDQAAARSARQDRGVIPPKPPLYDVRTPEYTVFDDIRADAWECVRGIDRSFGYNRASTEELHLGREELVSSFADIVAKGGNLLLNVGPRGEDAQIPDRQLRRLAWLGSWTDHAADAVYDTRPWVRPSARTPSGGEVRFSARGGTVWATITPDATGPTTIPGLASTPTTEVAAPDGAPLAWRTTAAGLEVDLPTTRAAPEAGPGTVVALRDVTPT